MALVQTGHMGISTLSVCYGATLGDHFPVQFRECRCDCVEVFLRVAVGLVVLASKSRAWMLLRWFRTLTVRLVLLFA